MLAGDRLQIAVFDDERSERIVVEEKRIAFLEGVFGSFCEEFSSHLEGSEVFQLKKMKMNECGYSVCLK